MRAGKTQVHALADDMRVICQLITRPNFDPAAVTRRDLWHVWHVRQSERNEPDTHPRFTSRARLLPFAPSDVYGDGHTDATIETWITAAWRRAHNLPAQWKPVERTR
jgi:hypothetical protein